jgi:hypothetical protein
MLMNKLSTNLLIFLLVANLQLPMLSHATIVERKSSQPDGKQCIKAIDKESAMSSHFDCLPEEYKLTDVVSYRSKRKGGEDYITIEDRLVEIKAQCKKGKLIDSKGREIKFFKFSCFGNPPMDYEEIAQKERDELDKLQKDYTVIVLECDPHIS